MRHGPAEDQAPSGRDFDRRLTPHGRRVVERVAQEMVRRNLPISRIVASPLQRARQTAERVHAILEDPEQPLVVETHEDLAEGWGEGLLRELLASAAGSPGTPSGTLVVGHQPTVEIVVRHLLSNAGRLGSAAGRLSLLHGFATATVVSLDLGTAGGARLLGTIEPATLA